ncbi:Isochorismatase hydrolase [Mycena maculata]|uniref:Isochorismatase hydrolase n=1 Tax=Mycena maculata TaxID=230809 RepID=A0AAD7P192_9AGAR|nr:Isochorismatase hydrolase [Mycena maculata]
MPPLHDTPILGMVARPRVTTALEYGSDANPHGFWTEYPSGLIDVSRTAHLPRASGDAQVEAPPLTLALVDIPVDGDRTVRVKRDATAMVIIDMQNFFLHPDLRAHPTRLKCVDPLMKAVPALRDAGIKILWVNWGLTEHELETIPPSLVRGFMKNGRGGFGAEIPGGFGRLLMRDAKNSELYGPLQDEFLKGKAAGTDFWINKNRMSGLWGYQSSLDYFLQENGISTLLFAGVNADQCVGGTLVDAYFRGYDCILVEDATATTSPEGGFENVVYNAGNSYGFVTDTTRLVGLQ